MSIEEFFGANIVPGDAPNLGPDRDDEGQRTHEHIEKVVGRQLGQSAGSAHVVEEANSRLVGSAAVVLDEPIEPRARLGGLAKQDLKPGRVLGDDTHEAAEDDAEALFSATRVSLLECGVAGSDDAEEEPLYRSAPKPFLRSKVISNEGLTDARGLGDLTKTRPLVAT